MPIQIKVFQLQLKATKDPQNLLHALLVYDAPTTKVWETSACSARVRCPTTKVLETSACSTRVRHPTTKVLEAALLELSSSSESEDDACFVCGKNDPLNYDGVAVDWISCRNCDWWYHMCCLDSSVDDSFVCHLCED